MAVFSLFVDVTGGPFDKIAQKGRNVTLSMLFRTFCHVVYATLGSILIIPHIVSTYGPKANNRNHFQD